MAVRVPTYMNCSNFLQRYLLLHLRQTRAKIAGTKPPSKAPDRHAHIEEQVSITNQRLTPSGSRPQQRPGLRSRRAHSLSSLSSHVSNAATPNSQCKTRLHAPTMTKIQMRRLQKGDDANGVIVARPERTGLSPLDDSARGENDAPNMESGAQPASPSP